MDNWQPGWVHHHLVQRLDSPNYDNRPGSASVCLIVIHAISLPPGKFGGKAVEALFTNRLDPLAHPYYADIHKLRVSTHFYIRRNGQITQFVATHARAWHAGVSSWQGRNNCNDFSIGIELEGCDSKPFEAVQYHSLSALTHWLQQRYPIEAIVSHADIAPGRKTDPGPCFDWPYFHLLLQPRLRIRRAVVLPSC